MIYTVSTDEAPKITLCETDPLKSVIQNIYLILATRKNTVPMYRKFGLPMAFIDKPSLAAETISAAEIREAIEEFEPRAEVTDILYETSEHGAVLSVKLEVRV